MAASTALPPIPRTFLAMSLQYALGVRMTGASTSSSSLGLAAMLVLWKARRSFSACGSIRLRDSHSATAARAQ
uniref:Putative secreted protein n=1 Tax=Ixodes ricinus TaxID=34613 RepID=A0A6B0TYE8_IXORI